MVRRFPHRHLPSGLFLRPLWRVDVVDKLKQRGVSWVEKREDREAQREAVEDSVQDWGGWGWGIVNGLSRKAVTATNNNLDGGGRVARV